MNAEEDRRCNLFSGHEVKSRMTVNCNCVTRLPSELESDQIYDIRFSLEIDQLVSSWFFCSM